MYQSFNARAVGLPNLPWAETIEVAAEAGFEAVDLMVRDLVEGGANLGEVRRRLDDRGLRVGAFPLPINWRRDQESFRIDLAALPRWTDAAARLGLTRTGTWVLPETPTATPAGVGPADHRATVLAWQADRLIPIARVLAGHGIRLGLEVIGVPSFRRGDGLPLTTRMENLDADLAAVLDEPNVGVLVDAFHLHAAAELFDRALAWGADRVVWAHIADLPPGADPTDRAAIIDAERGLPGPGGAIDCQGFLALLLAAGYDGPVTLEPLANCAALLGLTPDLAARRVKRALEACWPDRST